MKLTAKVDVRRLKLKMRKWLQAADKEQQAAVREYGADALQRVLRHTSPGDGKASPTSAITKLRRRIREEWEGQGDAVPFQDSDVSWFTDAHGNRRAYFKAGASSATGRRGQAVTGRVSPFRPVFGRPTRKVLAVLNVGRYGVKFVPDIDAFLRETGGNYRVHSSGRGKKARLSWHGPRHLAPVAQLRRQTRIRRSHAGALMAGWKKLAEITGGKMPAAVKKHTGRGSARITRSLRHGAILTATNSSGYTALQRHVDATVPAIRKRLRTIARRRAKQKFAPALRNA